MLFQATGLHHVSMRRVIALISTIMSLCMLVIETTRSSLSSDCGFENVHVKTTVNLQYQTLLDFCPSVGE